MAEKAPSPEQVGEQEPRVVLRIIVGRHGPKLSAEGEKNEKAAYFDEHVREGFGKMGIDTEQEGLAHIGTSDVERAVHTANIHAEELSKTAHRFDGRVSEHGNLTVPYKTEEDAEDPRQAVDLITIKGIQKELKTGIAAQIEQDMPDANPRLKEAELRNRIDMEVMSRLFADAGKKDDERVFAMPVKDIAARFAKRYAGFARHTNLLTMLQQKSVEKEVQPENEPYLQMDISHSFPVTAFLKEYLVFDDGARASDLSPEAFFERTGGIIRESGSFEMEYVVEPDGNLVIKVQGEFAQGVPFRGTLDADALHVVNPAA